MFIKDGTKTPLMIASAVICPPIQSIVVVTSPMGDHAPPALAAITMIPAKNQRSSLRPNIFRLTAIITIVVVRLSSTALRKNVTKPIIHNRVVIFVVLILSVMTLKPS